jgi:hypothetical protein
MVDKFDFLVSETRGKMKGLANKSLLLVLENTNESIELFNEIMILLDEYDTMLNDAVVWHDFRLVNDIFTKIHMNYKEIKDILN